MSPTDPQIRKDLAAALKERFGSHPAFPAVAAKFPVEGAADPSEVGRQDRAVAPVSPRRDLLPPGPRRRPPGRDEAGAGRDAARGPAARRSRSRSCRRRRRSSRCRRATSCGGRWRTRSRSWRSRTRTRRRRSASCSTSFGGSLTVQEVKDHLSGIVPEERWTAFWSAARKHQQVLVAGSAKSAKVSWSESAGAADDSVRQAFEKATPAARIDLARKHAKRSKDLARFMGETLAQQARRDRRVGSPALAWELSQAAARLVPEAPEAYPGRGPALGRPAQGAARDPRSPGPGEGPGGRPRVPGRLGGDLRRADRPRGGRPRPDDALRRARRPVRRRLPQDPALAALGAPRVRVAAASGCTRRARPSRPALFVAMTDALRMDEFSGLRARHEGVLRAGGPRRGARAPGGFRGGGAGAAPRPRPRGGPRGAPSGHRARGAPDEVSGAARAGARVPLRDGGVDRGAAPGAACTSSRSSFRPTPRP